MSKASSSRRWLRRQSRDPYVEQARTQGLRSRAVFKLQQIDLSYRLFRPGMTIIDLGAAPGGWSQYAAQRIGHHGRVIAIDRLPMESLDRVEFVQGDLREQRVVEQLLTVLREQKADVVLSDMAPDATGMVSIDQPRSMQLAEFALECAQYSLNRGGDFLVKLFQGEGFNEFIVSARTLFAKTIIKEPHASRARNREVYLLGRSMLEKYTINPPNHFR